MNYFQQKEFWDFIEWSFLKPLEITPNKVENGKYKINIDNNQEILLKPMLNNEDCWVIDLLQLINLIIQVY